MAVTGDTSPSTERGINMSDKNGNGFFSKIGSLLGINKVDQSTGKTTAENTQKAFTDDIAGLGTLVSNLGLDKNIVSKLEGLTSLDLTQIQSILGALSQSADPKVQDAKNDLQSVQHDGETFVTKLKGYIEKLPQLASVILPVLKNILGGNK